MEKLLMIPLMILTIGICLKVESQLVITHEPTNPRCSSPKGFFRMCRAWRWGIQWYYNKNEGVCEQRNGWVNLCGNGPNDFRTETSCQKACVCTLPASVGRCRAAIPRYYYNSATKECELFTYGGCDANGNNFDTIEDCKNTCGSGGLSVAVNY